jgi:hypothetical protein
VVVAAVVAASAAAAAVAAAAKRGGARRGTARRGATASAAAAARGGGGSGGWWWWVVVRSGRWSPRLSPPSCRAASEIPSLRGRPWVQHAAAQGGDVTRRAGHATPAAGKGKFPLGLMAAVRADLGLLAAQRDTDSCCWQVLRIRLRSTLLEGASLLSNPGVQPGARRAGEARPNGQKPLE